MSDAREGNAELAPANAPLRGIGNLDEPVRRWLADLAVLLTIFACFYLGQLAVFTLSIDDEVNATKVSPVVWIMQGRWGIYLLNRFVLPQPVVPFLPIALFGVFAAIGYRLLVNALATPRLGFVHFALFPFFVAFPTWLFLVEFDANAPAAGIGVAACCLSLLLVRRWLSADVSRSWWPLLSALALGIFAASLYQALALFLATLVVAAFLLDLLDERKSIAEAFRSYVVGAVVAGLSVVLYFVSLWISLRLAGVELGYVDQLIGVERLLDGPLSVIKTILIEAWRVYSGNEALYGAPAWMLALPTLLGLIAIFVASRRWSPPRRILVAVVALAVLFTPFNMYLLYGGRSPPRLLVAVPPAVWLFGLIGFTYAPRRLAKAGLVLLPLAYLHIFYANNILGAPRMLVQAHDAALASALHERIGHAIARSPAPIRRIDLFGGKRFETVYPMPRGSTIGSSFFSSRSRPAYYMRLIGLDLPEVTEIEEHRTYYDEYLRMPAWPAEGAIKALGEVLLVKLSEKPTHGEEKSDWAAEPKRRLGDTNPPPLYRLSSAPDDSWSIEAAEGVERSPDGISFLPAPRAILLLDLPAGTLERCMHVEAVAALDVKTRGDMRMYLKPRGMDFSLADTRISRVAAGALAGLQTRDRLGFENQIKFEIGGNREEMTVKEIELRCLASMD